jgi:hypothetical protein
MKQAGPDLRLKQEHQGLIEISTAAAKLYIDQTEAFADANLKSPLRLGNEFASKALSQASEYVAKTAQQGEQLKRIENGNGAIAQIAKQNSEIASPEAVPGYMPRSMSRVKFDYQPSEVTVKAANKPVQINVNRRDPQIEIPKWQTDAYIQQKNQISFQVVGGHVNRGL